MARQIYWDCYRGARSHTRSIAHSIYGGDRSHRGPVFYLPRQRLRTCKLRRKRKELRIVIVMATLLLGGCAHLSLPNLNGTCPAGYPVKGNANSHLYHVPESPYYTKTIAEFCFDSTEAARKNGFVAPKR